MALKNYKKLLEIKVNFKELFNKSNLSPISIANLLGITSRRTVDDLKFREYGEVSLELYLKMLSSLDISLVLENTIITDLQTSEKCNGQEYLLRLYSTFNKEDFIRLTSNEVKDRKIKELQSKIDLIKGIVGLEL